MDPSETSFSYRGHAVTLATFGADDHISRIVASTRGFYELDVLERAAVLHLPGTAIIDVGANLGNHTVFFAKILGAHVHAFEPFPPAFALLERNIARNALGDRVVATRAAIGRDVGAGVLDVAEAGNRGKTKVRRDVHGDVAIATLDSLAIARPVGLIKVDVEGAECEVLRGGEHLIARDRPDLFVEAEDDAAFARLLERALALGYVFAGRYAWTPTYLFVHRDQPRRLHALLERLRACDPASPRAPR